MTHEVDGFDLKFTHRRSWKAERRDLGKVVDIIPVTWTKAYRFRERLLEVWYQDPTEMEAQRHSRVPFVVAVAEAKDFEKQPREFCRFTAIFEVVATGVKLEPNSIETRVIRRVSAGKTTV